MPSFCRKSTAHCRRYRCRSRRFNCKHVLRLIDPVHDISKIEEFRAITSSEGYRAKRGDDVVGDAV
jgi:hypothetical protein